MGEQRVENVLQGLRSLQEQPLSIIRLSESISAGNGNSNGGEDGQSGQQQQRNSDASSSAFENPSPASLEADLAHYKDLFSKLRFSYLEQVTKEKFLRAIVGDPPLIVEPTENVALEAHLASTKEVLRAQKREVADMVTQLDERARELSRRHETVALQVELLETLPAQIEGLEGTVEELWTRNRSAAAAAEWGGEGMNLPLDATEDVIRERREKVREVEGQLKALRQGLPRQTRALEQEERELKVLEGERARRVGMAREAKERRKNSGEGGSFDELEMRGRWLRGVESGLKEMLAVG